MTKYRYNALDIAAYLKWTGMPSDREREQLRLLYDMREPLLARPISKDIELFYREVFRQMYHLWARGFENEFSDVARIADEGQTAIFCDQEYLPLESYMKLLALHLILSDHLPYIRINFTGLPLLTGVEGPYHDFERNVALSAKALCLSITGSDGKDINPEEGLPEDISRIRLNDEFRREIFGESRFRKPNGDSYTVQLQLLKDISQHEKAAQDLLKEQARTRSRRSAVTRPATEDIDPPRKIDSKISPSGTSSVGDAYADEDKNI